MQSSTDMYNCTHGPKKDCHACLVGELVAALEKMSTSFQRLMTDVINERGYHHLSPETQADVVRAHALIVKAHLIEDCIPSEEAEEASRT